MYHWIEDKEFEGRMRRVCSGMMNELKQMINQEDQMRVEIHLVGSGARNMITQNAEEPVDLDFNLYIQKISFSISDCRTIKEYVRKKFDVILKRYGLGNCEDSHACLTSGLIYFEDNQPRFSIDLAIVADDNKGKWYRLIHEKTGNTHHDRYFWNEGPVSKDLNKKVKWLKDEGLWQKVRQCYLDKKNMYLTGNNYDHVSFNCYIEAVNEIYGKYR